MNNNRLGTGGDREKVATNGNLVRHRIAILRMSGSCDDGGRSEVMRASYA